ncbi:MAG: XdhA protein [Osedax symbiont Rs1]|nr:MAG: XdhA protein [Osedax symbiont Rs1]
MIEFLLNNDKTTLHSIDPNTTVLEYLRNHRQRTGTKEGCASGDCGACTVVTAELAPNQQLLYKNINACITLISSLDGKQLITVEDLKNQQQLHSCQQAMVDTDGSQCGFCTPGFVMSLFALKKNQQQQDTNTSDDRHQVQQTLAGNLCRCTGYNAIYKAAEQTLNTPDDDQFSTDQAHTIAQLLLINNQSGQQSTVLSDDQHHCYMPKNIDQLAQLLLTYPDSTLVAGGTDLAIGITQHAQRYHQLISINQVSQLQIFTVNDRQIEIGAALSLHLCQQKIAPYFDDFAQLLERFASLQIRHQGTLGGNIANASPIGDTPPALIALSAKLQLRKGTQTRQVELEDFFIDYRKTSLASGEFIEKIIIPLPAAQSLAPLDTLLPASDCSGYAFKVYKVSKRLDDDISAICAASYIHLDQQRTIIAIKLAYGGMAATPKRAKLTEAALLGKTFTQQNIEAALANLAKDFTPMSDFRASSDYRLLVAQNLLRKLYIELQVDDTKAHKTRIFDYV